MSSVESSPRAESPPTSARAQLEQSAPADAASVVGSAAGIVGWVLVAIFQAVGTLMTSKGALRHPSIGAHAYQLGQALAAGVLTMSAVWAYDAATRPLKQRVRGWRSTLVDVTAITVVAIAIAFVLVGPDLQNFAGRFAAPRHLPPGLLHGALVILVGCWIPCAFVIGTLADKRYWRIGALVVAATMAVGNNFILRGGYPGAHLFVAWAAATFAAASVAAAHVPPLRSTVKSIALAACCALAVASIASRPSEKTMRSMLRTAGSTFAPFIAQIRAGFRPKGKLSDLPPDMVPWASDRSGLADVASTAPPHSADGRIVLMLTVDSLRAEVVASGKYDEELPEIASLRDSGLYFEDAHSPGANTTYTFSQVFASKYFSQLYWTEHPTEGNLFPHLDESVRFPELLTKAGVSTVYFPTWQPLRQRTGVARGFREEVGKNATGFVRPVPTKKLADQLIKRLERQGPGGLFVAMHFLDAHYPYTRGGKKGSSRKLQLRALAGIDRQLGRIRQAIVRLGLEDRTTIIFGADHGEAFGEHGTRHHGSSVYEVLVHVPFAFVGSGIEARRDKTPVSLIDIGPTVLDLFGLPTPATFMGQSLAPMLRGEPVVLTRPIAAETRLKRMVILPDGLKLIHDDRFGESQIFDIDKDPDELTNLLSKGSNEQRARLKIVTSFFDCIALKKDGYSPPYRQ